MSKIHICVASVVISCTFLGCQSGHITSQTGQTSNQSIYLINEEGKSSINLDEVFGKSVEADDDMYIRALEPDKTSEGEELAVIYSPYQETSFSEMSIQNGFERIPNDLSTGKSGAMNVYTDISGAFIQASNVNFEEGSSFLRVLLKSKSRGLMNVRTNNLQGDNICALEIEPSNDFVYCDVTLPEKISGITDLFFVFDCEEIELASWEFIKAPIDENLDELIKSPGYLGQADINVDKYVVNMDMVTERFCPNNIMVKRDGVEYGNVEKITYYSESVGCNRRANVLLPSDYDKKKEYPVIYFLHGMYGNEERLLFDPHNRIKEIVGNLYMDGLANEVIMIFPDIYATSDGNLEPGLTKEQLAPYDNFINDLTNDLIPYVESQYSVLPGRENRGIIGFSMGGRQALYIGLVRSDLFDYIGAFSPGQGLVQVNTDGIEFEGQLLEEEVRPANPSCIPSLIMICCGTKDQVVWTNPLKYHCLLEGNNVSHIWYEIPEAEHDANIIRSGLYNFLIRFQKNS